MKEKASNLIKTSVFVIKILFKNTPAFIICYAMINIVMGLIPAVNIILSKNIIDGLVAIYNGGDSAEVWKYIIILFILMIINAMLNEMGMTIPEFIRAKNEKYLVSVISDKFSKIEIKHLEDKKSADAIQAVMNSQFYISGSFDYVVNYIPRYIITFVSTISILFAYYPLIAVFYLTTTIPSVLIGNFQSKKMDQFSIDSIPETRKKDYLYNILTQSYYAKDLRLYNLSTPFINKYNELWKKIIQEREKIFKKGFKGLNFSTAVSSLGYVVMYIYLIYKTYAGDLSIGGLTAFTAGIMTVSSNFSGLVGSLMAYQNIFVPRVLSAMEFFTWGEENNANNENLQIEKFDIEFRNVTFKYPNTDTTVLRNLSFAIKDGEKIALVGVNGAGKSTIVKLILRMYEPDEGEILINGVNIKDYDVYSYRQKFSACFQDIVHYSLTFAENIALSNLSKINNLEAIIESANAGGLDNIQEAWEKKLDTPLTRNFEENGVEPSGGQWQKIAIARAFFRNAPFVILDEPSSALDPKAESLIFNSFSDLCGNKSGLLISHRLSSIMIVDRIIFLESGQIKETGAHAELMKQNGTYAEMYNLQAEKYKTKTAQAGQANENGGIS